MSGTTALLIVVVVDSLVFLILDLLFTNVIAVDGFWVYISGGVVVGLLSFLIDNLLGLMPPILDDQADREWSAP